MKLGDRLAAKLGHPEIGIGPMGLQIARGKGPSGAPPPPSFLLLADGASKLLLADGASKMVIG